MQKPPTIGSDRSASHGISLSEHHDCNIAKPYVCLRAVERLRHAPAKTTPRRFTIDSPGLTAVYTASYVRDSLLD